MLYKGSNTTKKSNKIKSEKSNKIKSEKYIG